MILFRENIQKKLQAGKDLENKDHHILEIQKKSIV